MPNLIIISGPNGAGKSTLAPYLLRDTFGITEYVNADTIAQGLSAFAPEKSANEAGRIMLRHLKALAKQRKDFAFESTLASKFYGNWIKELKDNGYEFHLIFLYLQSPELAIERVKERVRAGGHNIPEETIIRRYNRGLKNFFEIYQLLADNWRMLDVSFGKADLIAFKGNRGIEISNKGSWKQIKPKMG